MNKDFESPEEQEIPDEAMPKALVGDLFSELSKKAKGHPFGGCRERVDILENYARDVVGFKNVKHLILTPKKAENLHPTGYDTIDEELEWKHHHVLEIEGDIWDPYVGEPTTLSDYLSKIFPGQDVQIEETDVNAGKTSEERETIWKKVIKLSEDLQLTPKQVEAIREKLFNDG